MSYKAVDGKHVGPNTNDEAQLGATCYAGEANQPYWTLHLNNTFEIQDVSVYGRGTAGLGM